MAPHETSKLWWTKCKSDIGNAVGRDEEMIVVVGRPTNFYHLPAVSPGLVFMLLLLLA
jgi:hypothetical protein